MNNAGGSIIKAGGYSPDDYTAGYRFMGIYFMVDFLSQHLFSYI